MPIYNVNLSISESGKIVTLITQTGRVIAQLYCDGPLNIAAYNASNNIPFEKGRVNIFRGDIMQLEKYEFLDIQNECISNKENNGNKGE